MVQGPIERLTCRMPPRKKAQINPIVFDIRDRAPESLSQETIDEIESLDFNYIHEGQDRAAFESNNCVLKVGKSYESFQNTSEINSWENKLTDEQKKYFAPVKDHGADSAWLTMPKADTDITDHEWLSAVTSIIIDAGIDLIDFNRGNFGKLDGDVVCIDYGTGTRIIDESSNVGSRYKVLSKTMQALEEEV